MICVWDNHEFFVADDGAFIFYMFAGHLFERAFAEVAAVRICAMDNEHGIDDFVGVSEQFGVEQRNGGDFGPAFVGVERAFVIAARRFIIGVVIFDELRSLIWNWVDDAAGAFVSAVFIIDGALLAHGFARSLACFGVVESIVVIVGGDAAHVVHRRGDSRFDARVDGCRVDGHASPAADAQNADGFGIDAFVRCEKVNSSAKILGINVWRVHVTRFAATLASERRVECDGQKSALSKGLCVQAGRLLLDRAERAAHCDGRQLLSRSVLGHVHICGECDAETVAESDFLMVDFVALLKDFVPVLLEIHGLHSFVVGLIIWFRGIICGVFAYGLWAIAFDLRAIGVAASEK